MHIKKLRVKILNRNILFMGGRFLFGLSYAVIYVSLHSHKTCDLFLLRRNSKVLAPYSDPDPFEMLCPLFVANVN